MEKDIKVTLVRSFKMRGNISALPKTLFLIYNRSTREKKKKGLSYG